ncbi:metal-dependent hydrolase family protein [Sphingomonas baiyangensis]|uniref:Amidohydrolase family protein n=1 Tax=Sphingomonas baiyangensis TaxID=2572576 RepID=A0A4U1L368_9SPHN|nr:amidohydrolase family protein [Sphingomonas baiyangensis]TKD51351.1 amidohydrolase family protein [Sphingomonas baiyangensis]
MRMMFLAATMLATATTMASAQTAPPPPAATPVAATPVVTYIHAGQLLARPGERPRGQSTIIVRDGRIAEVRDGFAQPEAGAELVDLRSQYVLPGLIDMHVHFYSSGYPLQERLEGTTRDLEDQFVGAMSAARKTLDAGFTTVRDLGGEPRGVRALRDAIARGEVVGPTIVNAGRMVSVTAGHGDANGLRRELAHVEREASPELCNGADDCRRATREQIFTGAEVIKFAASGGVGSNIAGGLEAQMTYDEMKAIVDTAHAFGRKATAHAHGKSGIDTALRAGVDSIEHGSYIDDETIALFRKTGAYLVPTMHAFESVIRQGRAGERPAASAAKAEQVATVVKESHRRAFASGINIAFGTDSGVGPHGTNGLEFGYMTAVGMEPARALRVATVDAAKLLGREDRIGTIEPGKDADIIAVAGDPLADIARMNDVGFVMRRGVVHKLGGERRAGTAN